MKEDRFLYLFSLYITPYMINMESLFEFYVRTVFKEYFKTQPEFELEKYSKKLFIEKNVSLLSNTVKERHLIPYCIPDILIKKKSSGKYIAVFDAKYKDSYRGNREDSYQLLSYVLLTGAVKCGFIFPCKERVISQIKEIDGKECIALETPIISNLNYYEILFNEVVDSSVINRIL